MTYKLLVAEHVAAERTALCSTLLRHFGDCITIYEASDGAEALHIAEQILPDIAILNTEMPVSSGLEVAHRIRELGNICALLFISDCDNFFYAKQAIVLRALDYILKPYDVQKLILSVQEAMGYRKQIRRISADKPAVVSDSQNSGIPAESTRVCLIREDINSFIEAHYAEELSMKTVARAMNYSDAYFCKLFKQCFHVNFSSYLNDYRIEKAKTFMANPRISVKDIGLACGYSDPNYFTRVFKRITGQTPTEYRMDLLSQTLQIKN